jgi:hypothetical protein
MRLIPRSKNTQQAVKALYDIFPLAFFPNVLRPHPVCFFKTGSEIFEAFKM